jgi:hypothetical protein
MVAATFPPRLDYLALIPWALFVVAVHYLSRAVRLLDRIAARVEEQGERLATVEGVLAKSGQLERRRPRGASDLSAGL